MKSFRDAEKEEILETEMNHNFEADMYLEKLEQDNEKVNDQNSKVVSKTNNFKLHIRIKIVQYFQKMERSDSNDILGTYFRPRRAAELIHQNQVLHFWKDYKKTGQALGSWMTPTTLPNHTSSPNTWQPIPSSAMLKSVRNGNTSSRNTLDDLKNKPFYGVRPTHVQLNNNSVATNDHNMYKTLNYPHYSNETGDRTLHSLRNPITPTPFLRDNFG